MMVALRCNLKKFYGFFLLSGFIFIFFKEKVYKCVLVSQIVDISRKKGNNSRTKNNDIMWDIEQRTIEQRKGQVNSESHRIHLTLYFNTFSFTNFQF